MTQVIIGSPPTRMEPGDTTLQVDSVIPNHEPQEHALAPQRRPPQPAAVETLVRKAGSDPLLMTVMQTVASRTASPGQLGVVGHYTEELPMPIAQQASQAPQQFPVYHTTWAPSQDSRYVSDLVTAPPMTGNFDPLSAIATTNNHWPFASDHWGSIYHPSPMQATMTGAQAYPTPDRNRPGICCYPGCSNKRPYKMARGLRQHLISHHGLTFDHAEAQANTTFYSFSPITYSHGGTRIEQQSYNYGDQMPQPWRVRDSNPQPHNYMSPWTYSNSQTRESHAYLGAQTPWVEHRGISRTSMPTTSDHPTPFGFAPAPTPGNMPVLRPVSISKPEQVKDNALQPIIMNVVPQKRTMGTDQRQSKKPRSSEVQVIDISDDESSPSGKSQEMSGTKSITERSPRQAVATKLIEIRVKSENMLARTVHPRFSQADEREFRRGEFALRERRPDIFTTKDTERNIEMLKRNFISYPRSVPREKAFKMAWKKSYKDSVGGKGENASPATASCEDSTVKKAADSMIPRHNPFTRYESTSEHKRFQEPPVHRLLDQSSTQSLLTPPPSSPPQETIHPPPILTKATEPQLCKEQSDLVNLILSGRNVFYTGSAGCGKSTVLKAFVSELKANGKRVKIVAPTGRAALDINGSTTWTFAGWTPNHMKKPIAELEKGAHGKFVRRRLKNVDVLVMDEISMVENLHFERLNRLMKEARGNQKAFGGVQLVVTGDFCQLPPVKPFQFCMECGKELMQVKTGSVYKCREHGDFLDENKWAFRSSAWQECGFEHIHLTKIHRQSDEIFIRILQKLRIGSELTSMDRDILLNHPSDTTNAIRLFSTHVEVKRVNDAEFARLQTRKLDFKCLDSFKWNQEHRHLEWYKRRQSDGSLAALKDHRLDPVVELKQGTLVVLLTNLDITSGLVNGSQGRVVGFQKYSSGNLPKALSTWRQEMGGPGKKGEISIPPGVQTLAGEHALLREGEIKRFIQEAKAQEWPVVRFDNGIQRVIFAECRVNEMGDEEPYSLLMRTQIPLVPAWAMTVHKSQGMTLNKVVVDLARSFESGQEYVALSRATSLEGLKVESLGQKISSGDEQVKAFLAEKFGIKRTGSDEFDVL